MKFNYNTMRFGKKERRITIYHLRKPVMRGFIGLGGMIESKQFSDRISICVDCRPSDELDYLCMCLSHSPASGRAEIWMQEAAFYGIKRGEPMSRTALFHELGHEYHNHCLKSKEDVDAYDKARVKLADDGDVKQEELDADQFAAEYLGRDYVMKGLSDLKAPLSKCVVEEEYEKHKELALKELDLRIERLRHL